MKQFLLYNPGPVRNEYLSGIYFSSLLLHDPKLTRTDDIDSARDSVILLNGDYLKPERIVALKDAGNTLIAFDINDHTSLSDSYRYNPECALIDLIFKIGGVQKINISKDVSVDSEFKFSLVDRQFIPDECWLIYDDMANTGRIQSLPYVPWTRNDVPHIGFRQRSGNTMVRGGNHLYRFLVFLNLLKIGKVDPRSAFMTEPYFIPGMDPRFRYCRSCIDERNQNGGRSVFGHLRPGDCTSPAEWGGKDVVSLLRHEEAGRWNNRCPRSFIWLTEQFERFHGPVDRGMVERTLSGKYEQDHPFFVALSQATFYTDLKWLHSIYAPPRFWEAAKVGTINFLPRRTNEQDYFPQIKDGEHYKTFLEDFSDFDPSIEESEFNYISQNAKELYDGWIRPSHRPISERLCRHVFTEIEIAVEKSK